MVFRGAVRGVPCRFYAAGVSELSSEGAGDPLPAFSADGSCPFPGGGAVASGEGAGGVSAEADLGLAPPADAVSAGITGDVGESVEYWVGVP